MTGQSGVSSASSWKMRRRVFYSDLASFPCFCLQYSSSLSAAIVSRPVGSSSHHSSLLAFGEPLSGGEEFPSSHIIRRGLRCAALVVVPRHPSSLPNPEPGLNQARAFRRDDLPTQDNTTQDNNMSPSAVGGTGDAPAALPGLAQGALFCPLTPLTSCLSPSSGGASYAY